MKYNESNMTTTKPLHGLYQMLIHNGPTKEAIATGGQYSFLLTQKQWKQKLK
jgi:hypothetical protein